MTRGVTVVATMSAVMESSGTPVPPATLHQAQVNKNQIDCCHIVTYSVQVVGWCIEWLQACFLVLDDIMDESITRRGQPCWYKLPEVGKMAINDGMMPDVFRESHKAIPLIFLMPQV